jgi:predicted DNA-binding transcriptional regulator YafY
MVTQELWIAAKEPDQFAVQIRYTDSAERMTVRVVSPIRFEQDKMLALCLTSGKPQFFVLERIESAVLVSANSVLMPAPLVELKKPNLNVRRKV